MKRHFLVAAIASLVISTSAMAGEYNLTIDRKDVDVGGRHGESLTINGQLPGPTLHFKEGEDVTIHVTNKLKEDTSLHWHGLLLPGEMDGVPGFNNFDGIKPGETFTYNFKVRQSGTYWYHSHSGGQEQEGLPVGQGESKMSQGLAVFPAFVYKLGRGAGAEGVGVQAEMGFVHPVLRGETLPL